MFLTDTNLSPAGRTCRLLNIYTCFKIIYSRLLSLLTFFCNFIKTFVLWKGNVSIAAALYVAGLIRNSALISAETITTTS